jgi:rSAM/selenodomain-associated transferase 1
MKRFHILDPTVQGLNASWFCALAIMTKAPKAGQVKTRLVPPLKPDEAAKLNKFFLRDTSTAIANSATGKDACGIAVYTPTGSESAYTDILPDNFRLLLQRGDRFGERLYFAALDLFNCGFESVCLIDSDSPTVPPENYAQAVKLLQCPGDRVVLGPCEDGGYYLIGLKKPHKELFERIDWSTERVLAQTRQRAREIGLGVKLLPVGYDVDDGASLQRLCKELLTGKQSDSVAPRTRRFLRDIIAREGRTRIWPDSR